MRGLAAAALWDASPPSGGDHAAGMRTRAIAAAEALADSRVFANMAWGGLIRAAARRPGRVEPLLTETLFRWIQWGWLE